MTDTQVHEAPARQRKQKAKPRVASPFAGLTNSQCCGGCTAEACAISGKSYCAHPKKGGLQHTDMGDTEALGRFNKAKKMLAHRAVDKRSG